MANIIQKTDTKLIISDSGVQQPLLGTWSIYDKQIHPGTRSTINGWEFDSRIWPSSETEYPTSAPSISDPDFSLIPKIDFQSGTGAIDDCEVLGVESIIKSGFIEDWCPDVNHGYFYKFNDQYYLYSDAVKTKYVLATDIANTVSTVILDELTKDGIPILARIWQWDESNNKYLVNTNFIKKQYFTGSRTTPTSARLSTWDNNTKQIIYANIDTSKSEFIAQKNGINPPTIIFNKIVTNEIGQHVSSSSDLATLEIVGGSNGQNKQIFHTKFSPIDKNSPIEVYSYLSPSVYQQWTPILNGTLTHSGFEVLLDTDLGILQFGDPALGDQIPPNGNKIVIRYTYTAEIKYEPQFTTDNIFATNRTANVNPIIRTNNRGFILIEESELIPYSVFLYTDLPTIGIDSYSPLDIGNTILPIHASVKTKNGEVIENIKVTFDLLDTQNAGLFANSKDEISGYTNAFGISTVYYLPPKTINDIGEYVTSAGYSTSGGNTSLTTSSLRVSSTVQDIYLYKVFKDDPILGVSLGDNTLLNSGIITQELNDWYKTNFFIPENIYGPTGLDPGTSLPTGDPGDLQFGAAWWEGRHRTIIKLLTPQSYNRSFRNGRKQIVSTWSSSALDPHFLETGAFVPLQPTSVVHTTTAVNTITFNGIVLDSPGTGDLDAYFVISPTSFRVQANIYDEITDRFIFSNIITVKLHIPNAFNGTVFIDDINNLPSTIVSYMLNSSDNGKILPLGFKIRQSGNTFASAIEGVTYLDINAPAQLDMTFNIDNIV